MLAFSLHGYVHNVKQNFMRDERLWPRLTKMLLASGPAREYSTSNTAQLKIHLQMFYILLTILGVQ
jgi:hypothetical protein